MFGGVNYIIKSSQPRPTTGVKDGEALYIVDTKETFVWYDGEWWPA